MAVTPGRARRIGAAALAAAAIAAALARVAGSRRRGRRDAEIERLQDANWNLAETAQHYRNLVEAGLDVVVQRDAAGRVTFANEAYAELVGVPLRELVGTTLRPSVGQTGARRARPDGAVLIDEGIETEKGLRWFAFVETAVPGRDGRSETLRAGREVTERVDAERRLEEAKIRAEAASEAKSRFLATVSHEFRTPLTGILGMADLILGTTLDPEQATYVRAIQTSGQTLLSLIDEVLDFSRIEAGRLDLAEAPFDPVALVEGVVELLAPRAQGKGLEIAAYVGPRVARTVVGDADRLRQVLVNLAGNAIKFTPAGGAGISVEDDRDGGIVIAVSDTGPGVPADRLAVIFEEFEQGEASARSDGAGLGLAITRRIVEGMGGTIEVESEAGRGATFRVRLPLAAKNEPEREIPESGTLAGEAVLILAQSPFEAPFLARRIREAGGTVRLAQSFAEAQSALAASHFDILIADCGLGAEVTRSLAAEARRTGVGRCVVLLSPFDRKTFGSPLAAGFDGYLVKPVRGRSLLSRLTGAVDVARAGAKASSGARSRVPAGSRPRVLLAEDNEINALLTLKALHKLGARAEWARNGFEALALAEASLADGTRGYDLVLMDVRMPGLDGLAATRRLRQMEAAAGGTTRLRVLALTANSLEQDREAARAAGFDGFLSKPLDFEALAELLRG